MREEKEKKFFPLLRTQSPLLPCTAFVCVGSDDSAVTYTEYVFRAPFYSTAISALAMYLSTTSSFSSGSCGLVPACFEARPKWTMLEVDDKIPGNVSSGPRGVNKTMLKGRMYQGAK